MNDSLDGLKDIPSMLFGNKTKVISHPTVTYLAIKVILSLIHSRQLGSVVQLCLLYS